MIRTFLLFSLGIVTSFATLISDNCIHNPPYMICNEKHNITDNFHICNNDDISTLFPFSSISLYDSTNYTTLHTEISLGKENLVLEKDNDGLNNMCFVEDTLIEHNHRIRIAGCYECACSFGEVKCSNKCNSQYYYNLDYTYEIPLSTTIHDDDSSKTNGYLYCPNERCTIEGCTRCTKSSDKREICLECTKPYYLFDKNPYVCYTSQDLLSECDEFLSYNPVKRVAHCNDCFSGRIEPQDDSFPIIGWEKTGYYRYGRCVCDATYHGDSCSETVDEYMCNGKGFYNNTSGTCEIHDPCIFGSLINDDCMCYHGYYGELCDNKIKCVFGDLIHNQCICRKGYTGSECSIPIYFKEHNYERNSKKQNHILWSSQGKNTCIDGWYGDDCYQSLCRNGYYDERSKACKCLDGYYGDSCSRNCAADCSFHGSSCNQDNVCICDDGFMGVDCSLREIQKSITPKMVNIQNISLRITTNASISLHEVSCYLDSCYQFSLTEGKQIAHVTIESNSTFIPASPSGQIIHHERNNTKISFIHNHENILFLSYHSSIEPTTLWNDDDLIPEERVTESDSQDENISGQESQERNSEKQQMDHNKILHGFLYFLGGACVCGLIGFFVLRMFGNTKETKKKRKSTIALTNNKKIIYTKNNYLTNMTYYSKNPMVEP